MFAVNSHHVISFQMYFNSTISDSTKLLKPVLVFAFAIAAALTGLTQITQHRSHPIDVYVGFLIGAFIAAYLVSLSRMVGGPRASVFQSCCCQGHNFVSLLPC